jgi:hypothetical protein
MMFTCHSFPTAMNRTLGQQLLLIGFVSFADRLNESTPVEQRSHVPTEYILNQYGRIKVFVDTTLE